MSGLAVRGLSVERGGGLVLRDLVLDAPGGAVTVLGGASGCGHTTLALALAGELPALAGSVSLAGRRLSGPPSARRRRGLAVVADGPRPAGCTVAEALSLAARHGRRPADALERVPRLGGRVHVRAERLSGGEQRLLAVACAWMSSPRALVLDNPLVGLAADAAEAVTGLARREAEEGCAVLWLAAQPPAALGQPRLLLAAGAVRESAQTRTESSWEAG